jgi:hypothetical protein
MYVVEMTSCITIFLSSFVKTGPGVHAILKFCLTNLRGHNVGITEGKDL